MKKSLINYNNNNNIILSSHDELCSLLILFDDLNFFYYFSLLPWRCQTTNSILCAPLLELNLTSQKKAAAVSSSTPSLLLF